MELSCFKSFGSVSLFHSALPQDIKHNLQSEFTENNCKSVFCLVDGSLSRLISHKYNKYFTLIQVVIILTPR